MNRQSSRTPWRRPEPVAHTIAQTRLNLISSPSPAFHRGYLTAASRMIGSADQRRTEERWLREESVAEEQATAAEMARAELAGDCKAFVTAYEHLREIRGRIWAIRDHIHSRRQQLDAPPATPEAMAARDLDDKDPFKEEEDDELLLQLRPGRATRPDQPGPPAGKAGGGTVFV